MKLAKSAGSIDNELLALLLDPENLSQLESAKIISSVQNQHCEMYNPAKYYRNFKRLVIKIDWQGEDLIIKYFLPNTSLRKLFYTIVRNDPLKNSFYLHQQLGKMTNVRTAAIYYWAQEKDYRFSFAVQEFLSTEKTIAEHLRKLLSNSSDRTKLEIEIIEWLASNFAQMHNERFFHRDIKPSHLFIKEMKKGLGSFVWIDLDRASCGQSLTHAQRINNLYHALRYFVYPIGWQHAEHFIYHYCEKSEDLNINPDQLLSKSMLFYQAQIQKVIATEPRGTNGLLTKEDFELKITSNS